MRRRVIGVIIIVGVMGLLLAGCPAELPQFQAQVGNTQTRPGLDTLSEVDVVSPMDLSDELTPGDIQEVEILDTIEVAEMDSAELDIQEVHDVCTPDCEGKECGDNGCNGVCGECPEPFICDDGQCTLCGNQTCDADETNANCPGDCPCPDNTWRHDDSGGGCYKLVAQSKVRAQALSHCEGLGGTLMKATPDNLDVMSLLYSDAGNEHFWIGLKWKQDCHSDCTKDNDEECRYGRWAWSLGACISYSGWASESAPWDSGEPNGDCSGAFCGCGITSNQWCSTSDECVEVINSAGKWNNLYCDNSLKFACEWMPE